MTDIYIGGESIPYFDLTITNRLHAADTATFTTNNHIEDMSVVTIIGEHHTFKGFILARREEPDAYKYECVDFTRLLNGKIYNSYYNKTSSDIITELLEARGLSSGGVTKTTKKHPKLIFKAKKAIDVCHQLANLETNMEFFINSDGVAVFRQIPETQEGYVFASPSALEYELKHDPTNIVTAIAVYGDNDKKLYNFKDTALIAKYGWMTEVIEDSGLKSQSEAKAKADELFKEKGKTEFSGSLTLPILKDMKAGTWIVFYPPSWSKNGVQSYYVQEVKTTINQNTEEQTIDLVNGKPSPPSEWIYEAPKEDRTTSTNTNTSVPAGIAAAVAAKAKSLGDPRSVRRWIDANIKYSFYYNKKYTPEQVLKVKKGNCFDQSDLFVDMVKALGFQAKRRCGVYCGDTRHCDAQIYMNGRWIQVDVTCHKRNQLV